ncbi:4-hydroxy-3-polyprenylbenzoate decarboxylase [Rhizobium sp. BK529]|uniref:UbiD family decarboxylase n=1 Tax=unclassified Rhizobium TaxID=2613769 RepID=UPI00104C5DE4|nr:MULTISPECIES: UbiD family decarboxylase [unclassified Rhizobium]MBB3593785.1 4-hydroxy-3-polyprenylbenzoate decarboxylase [Rhizobium sp. BK529]TCR95996.1 4-hydroxy-3-polyprenylbenzoate decarboxylase [Rhizobium sp. BK418]
MLNNAPKIKRHADLQSFIRELERRRLLVSIDKPVSLVHDLTALHQHVLEDNGPALLIRAPIDAEGRCSPIPVLVNLFGTRERIELGFGVEQGGLGRLAEDLADLRNPSPPKSLADALSKLSLLKAASLMRPRRRRAALAQAVIHRGAAIDTGMLPVQWCWPGEPAPLVTWPLVITRDPDDPDDVNVGIYRTQVRDRSSLIVRWLSNRGGARHFRQWQRRGQDMPVAIAIGADPATLLAAVMPLPEGVSELNFSSLLRGARTQVARALTVPLYVPACAEIILEGHVSIDETAPEGPFGDHTGYYNSVEPFPVVRLSAITTRRSPVYLSTYTGRPPDEPSRLGEAMTELFIPILRRQFPEICDLWLPPEACSYRTAVVSIDKRYPGQARRVMMGLWSMLPQFNYTKLIIVVDADIDVRSWEDIMWAVSTRFDASRDLTVVENTPIDYLDFASPRAGLGAKMGLDASRKIGPESDREWGRELRMPSDIAARAATTWERIKRDIVS